MRLLLLPAVVVAASVASLLLMFLLLLLLLSLLTAFFPSHRYFSQLSKNQVLGLYEKYRVDHELFGYSPEHFIELAQQEQQ